jgi:hypothetical protein
MNSQSVYEGTRNWYSRITECNTLEFLRQVLRSNLDRNTGRHDWGFLLFSSVFQTNTGTTTSVQIIFNSSPNLPTIYTLHTESFGRKSLYSPLGLLTWVALVSIVVSKRLLRGSSIQHRSYTRDQYLASGFHGDELRTGQTGCRCLVHISVQQPTNSRLPHYNFC